MVASVASSSGDRMAGGGRIPGVSHTQGLGFDPRGLKH